MGVTPDMGLCGVQGTDRCRSASSSQAVCVRRGQASLEMTVAMIGALLLLFGSLKIFLWINARLIERHKSYELGRVIAGSSVLPIPILWSEPQGELDVFEGD